MFPPPTVQAEHGLQIKWIHGYTIRTTLMPLFGWGDRIGALVKDPQKMEAANLKAVVGTRNQHGFLGQDLREIEQPNLNSPLRRTRRTGPHWRITSGSLAGARRTSCTQPGVRRPSPSCELPVELLDKAVECAAKLLAGGLIMSDRCMVRGDRFHSVWPGEWFRAIHRQRPPAAVEESSHCCLGQAVLAKHPLEPGLDGIWSCVQGPTLQDEAAVGDR